MKIDTLINARWIIPVEPPNRVLEGHSLAVQDGRIVDIVATTAAQEKYQAVHTHDLKRHALIPGLINCHTHAAMTLMRGLADDIPLMSWLRDHIWPAESRLVCEDFVLDGSRLAVAEMLRGGITCFNDMYFFPEVTARAAAEAGMRATIGLIVVDFPSAWANDADDYLARCLKVHDEFRNHALVATAFAPHAPYSVSDGPLRRIRVLADELDIPVHIHVHETADEVEDGLRATGRRPLARLDDLGLLSPTLMAVHMTQLQPEERERFAATGAHIVHCPESNLKLASGFCPVRELVAAGVNVALGTDGAASNNDLDMFSEMRTAALLAKGISGDPSALPAAQALQMATLNGAIALGRDAAIGSLVVGKTADITAVDLGDPETQPVYHPISQLVYATGRDKVTDVWVSGRQLLRSRQLTTLNEGEVLERALRWQARVAEHA